MWNVIQNTYFYTYSYTRISKKQSGDSGKRDLSVRVRVRNKKTKELGRSVIKDFSEQALPNSLQPKRPVGRY